MIWGGAHTIGCALLRSRVNINLSFMNSLFSDVPFSCDPSDQPNADAWVTQRASSIRNVLRYAQAFTATETSLGPAGFLQN